MQNISNCGYPILRVTNLNQASHFHTQHCHRQPNCNETSKITELFFVNFLKYCLQFIFFLCWVPLIVEETIALVDPKSHVACWTTRNITCLFVLHSHQWSWQAGVLWFESLGASEGQWSREWSSPYQSFPFNRCRDLLDTYASLFLVELLGAVVEILSLPTEEIVDIVLLVLS